MGHLKEILKNFQKGLARMFPQALLRLSTTLLTCVPVFTLKGQSSRTLNDKKIHKILRF